MCAGLAGCSQLTPDFGNAVAITVQGPTTHTVEEGDTLHLVAAALDASGATLPDTVQWALVQPIKRIDTVSSVVDTVLRGFTIGASTGTIIATSPDTSTVLAYLGTLRANPIQVIVSPMPDTVFTSLARVVVPLGNAESPGLATTVQDLTTHPGTPQLLGGKTVAYAIVTPGATTVYLEAHTTVSDTLPGTDPTKASVLSLGNGSAVMYVHRVAGQTAPDSISVQATGLTARGATVPGSPVVFTVVFSKN